MMLINTENNIFYLCHPSRVNQNGLYDSHIIYIYLKEKNMIIL